MANEEIGGAAFGALPTVGLPRRTRKSEIQGADPLLEPTDLEPPETSLPGLASGEVLMTVAGQTSSDDGHGRCEPHGIIAIVGNLSEIIVIHRRYEDLRRARQRLELQAMATCRSLCDGDKVAGAKLYRKPTLPAVVLLSPYTQAMAPLDAAIDMHAKRLDRLGKGLPVSDWCNSVSGLSPRFLSMVIGECGIGPGEYRTVSALWKRMGMAVIDGQRQRRVTGDAALIHGYVARRRSLMWNIGESIIKQQVRNPKGEDGKPLGDAVGIGEYGTLYLERKAYELTKTDKPIIAHGRAKRYMEKRLLRELWKVWRRATLQMTPSEAAPAAEYLEAAE